MNVFGYAVEALLETLLYLCVYIGTVDTPSLNDRIRAMGDYETASLVSRVMTHLQFVLRF